MTVDTLVRRKRRLTRRLLRRDQRLDRRNARRAERGWSALPDRKRTLLRARLYRIDLQLDRAGWFDA